MHYFFNDSINTETVNNLIEKLEGKEDIVLYFGTDGGATDSMCCLVSFFNSLGANIEIVLTDFLMSAGIKILTDYTGRLRHEGLGFILFHKFDREIYTLRKTSLVNESILVAQTDNENKIFAKKLKKLGLTKKQIKKYNKGLDVVLYKKDFHLINL
jgi:hypothetical protein|nr:MAG TPA: ATP-dependent Clp protease proteolytic subunit [Caudoviricetes sp.]